ncbi:MaoC family dehydratase [Sphingosinicella rhizophila]|uniref:MaoC family dehydratase n=1 Tax=Sphingosinicella rhizophila TaxID=3050082 RepID=A0ABU3Q5U5_9SPHN|nr:MaoC family dehydratase [Sphingosinicella sp. GR2756]MDT9598444.1 MaoC family dehydratase [Sphingosinicella sp. GR2756]
MIYFEDIEVGQTADYGTYEVTREEVVEFARKYDPQPFHLSDEAAAKTYFGRLSASGWHTCAMTMAVIARYMVDQQQAGLGSPGIDELRWLKPVYPGDTLHVAGKIVETKPSRSKPDIGSVRTETEVTNQHGESVMRYVSIVLMRRRPAD